MNCSLPGFSVRGISQARIWEWVAVSFPKGSSQPRDKTWLSCIAGRFFMVWATREAYIVFYVVGNISGSMENTNGCIFFVILPKDTKLLVVKFSAFLVYLGSAGHYAYPLSCSVGLTLCSCRDCSPLGSSLPGLLQSIIQEWVAISSYGQL